MGKDFGTAPVLEPIVASMRKRAGMYVGSTDRLGLRHLGYFALDALVSVGPPEELEVRIDSEGGMNVRAFPASIDRSFREQLERGQLSQPSSLVDELICVSALSERFFIGVEMGGPKGWTWSGRRGAPAADVEFPEPNLGTIVAFLADRTIFPHHRFEASAFHRRLRELAILYPGCRVSLFDEATQSLIQRCHPGGLRTVIDEAELDSPVGPLVSVETQFEDTRVRVAVQIDRQTKTPRIDSWANSVFTTRGGAHVDGLLRGISRVVPVTLGHPVGAIAVDVPRTQLKFRGPTREALEMPGLTQKVSAWIAKELRKAFAAEI